MFTLAEFETTSFGTLYRELSFELTGNYVASGGQYVEDDPPLLPNPTGFVGSTCDENTDYWRGVFCDDYEAVADIMIDDAFDTPGMIKSTIANALPSIGICAASLATIKNILLCSAAGTLIGDLEDIAWDIEFDLGWWVLDCVFDWMQVPEPHILESPLGPHIMEHRLGQKTIALRGFLPTVAVQATAADMPFRRPAYRIQIKLKGQETWGSFNT